MDQNRVSSTRGKTIVLATVGPESILPFAVLDSEQSWCCALVVNCKGITSRPITCWESSCTGTRVYVRERYSWGLGCLEDFRSRGSTLEDSKSCLWRAIRAQYLYMYSMHRPSSCGNSTCQLNIILLLYSTALHSNAQYSHGAKGRIEDQVLGSMRIIMSLEGIPRRP